MMDSSATHLQDNSSIPRLMVIIAYSDLYMIMITCESLFFMLSMFSINLTLCLRCVTVGFYLLLPNNLLTYHLSQFAQVA
jgi:hypothetical protein